MTTRERCLNILHYKDVDRLPAVHFGYWNDLLDEWAEQGHITKEMAVAAHGNNLKTVYNSIEVKDGLVEGANVEQGFVIGYVSDNNRQEYKDGPHLHFEVWENGEKISPYKYITVSEK